MTNMQFPIEEISSLRALLPHGRVKFDAQYERLRQSADDRLPGSMPPVVKWCVLIVEDDLPTSLVLKTILENLGFHVTRAQDGHEALVTLAETRQDMVFMDINMPGMDGITAVKEIRSGSRRSSELPIIALTTEGSDQAIKKMLGVGFDGIMSKPVRRHDLFHVILAAMANSQSEEQDGEPKHQPGNRLRNSEQPGT